MTSVKRRDFLKAAAGLAALPLTVRQALAIPADHRTGTIEDVRHVVILMQENRSFDHYFGCLKGVRGFGDPRPLILPAGISVFHQPVAPGASDRKLPFRFNSATTNAETLHSLDHSWRGPFRRWRHHDAWIEAKTPLTMGYFQREDIPFYYALADAFTVCDAYHCSVFGPTDPNRMYLFTGTSGLSVGDTGPQTIENADDGNWSADIGRDDPKFPGHAWTTYAERLQAAGISWQVYQEYDNFGDNSLAYFARFRNLDPASDLYRRGRAWVEGSTPENAAQTQGEHLIARFARDVAADALPQVSWLVAPYQACEHPNATPSIGQAFTAKILSALASNPKVWAKTVFILNYDENDGFFDHVPPAEPAIRPELGASTVSTEGEILEGEPFGLGIRVPALLVSPWTRGGWVNSQVFDHTSVIRFLEARFGVAEPNISPWRRAITGDLTSAFDFSTPNESIVSLPGVDGLIARLETTRLLPDPAMPEMQNTLPVQEPGVRPARPLPYRFTIAETVEAGQLGLVFDNHGGAGLCFRVVADGLNQPGPWFFTVEAGKTLTGTLPIPASADAVYALSIYGPNGFLRQLRGTGRSAVNAWLRHDEAADQVVVALANTGTAPVEVEVRANAYGPAEPRRYRLAPGERVEDVRPVAASGHWYDLTVTETDAARYLRRFAGHMETGRPSISDPAIAATNQV